VHCEGNIVDSCLPKQHEGLVTRFSRQSLLVAKFLQGTSVGLRENLKEVRILLVWLDVETQVLNIF
jgi:hypothetical protein